MKLLLSSDIEMNPGPVENVVSKSIGFSPQTICYAQQDYVDMDWDHWMLVVVVIVFFELLHTNYRPNA